MKTVLVVTQPFADYGKGDHITDPDAIKKALETNAKHVVRATHPGDGFYGDAEPKAAPKAKKAAPKATEPVAEPIPAEDPAA
jgi:uridylate kinase